MRRAQSVRHYARPSLALGADDLGMLREGDESNEDVLRKQLLEKDRECDRLQTTNQALQAQLAQRPSIEMIQGFEKEYKNLELLLQGTQRENERCMAELERSKAREKMLENALARLVGENWQATLELAPSATSIPRSLHQRSSTIASASSLSLPLTPVVDGDEAKSPEQQQATLAHIEQVRLLILGMEQRLQTREEKLTKVIERAENETKRFEELRNEVTVDS
ncbi:hypothetical protein BDQ17DRAFT_1397113 [Cyathus striatus]|nr:hypothetical protein BDQ17DRAFT_1262130 [Cyathus striatus]KAF9011204.1 hypothetical protein BDQ17DRAFT_1397113 [Cyathus striatus]